MHTTRRPASVQKTTDLGLNNTASRWLGLACPPRFSWFCKTRASCVHCFLLFLSGSGVCGRSPAMEVVPVWNAYLEATRVRTPIHTSMCFTSPVTRNHIRVTYIGLAKRSAPGSILCSRSTRSLSTLAPGRCPHRLTNVLHRQTGAPYAADVSRLAQHGMVDLVQTHFLEAAEVRPPTRAQARSLFLRALTTSPLLEPAC